MGDASGPPFVERTWECRIARKPLRGGGCRTEAERSFHFPRSGFQRERHGCGGRARGESWGMGEMQKSTPIAHMMRTELPQGILFLMSSRCRHSHGERPADNLLCNIDSIQ